MTDIQKAFHWAQILIQQTDEHLPCCSETLRVELIEQRGFAVTAVDLLGEKLRQAPNVALSLNELQGMEGECVYVTNHGLLIVSVDNDDFEDAVWGVVGSYIPLHSAAELGTYRRKPEGGVRA